MSKIYGDTKNWNEKNYKKSFENLANDGYSFDNINYENWFFTKIDAWKTAVLIHKNANKIIKETEKAVEFSVITQYGNEYNMWFPKSAIKKDK